LNSKALDVNDENLAIEALDCAAEALDTAKGRYQSKVHKLLKHWRMVYTLISLDSQVNNGGFHQFFTSTGGLFDSHLLEDIKILGIGDHVEVIKMAWDEYLGPRKEKKHPIFLIFYPSATLPSRSNIPRYEDESCLADERKSLRI
jgi:hypothetical protein